MIRKSVFFLAGLPRSGSTLLAAILAQNDKMHVTPTSPLYQLLCDVNESLNRLDVQYTFDRPAVSDKLYHSAIDAFYGDKQQPIIIDKHRMWPKHHDAITQYLNPTPKFICPVRPISEIITSFITLADKDPANFIDAHLRSINRPVTNESRADLLWNSPFYLRAPYDALSVALRTHPESVLMIDYRDIVFDPTAVIDRIYAFCDIEPFPHSFASIHNIATELKDNAWGIKDLHVVRRELRMQSAPPLAYLPQEAIDYFSQYDVRRAA